MYHLENLIQTVTIALLFENFMILNHRAGSTDGGNDKKAKISLLKQLKFTNHSGSVMYTSTL